MRMMYRVPKFCAVPNAVREQTRELFHLTHSVGHFGRNQAAKIAGEQVITIKLGWLIVTSRRDIVLNLAENPRI